MTKPSTNHCAFVGIKFLTPVSEKNNVINIRVIPHKIVFNNFTPVWLDFSKESNILNEVTKPHNVQNAILRWVVIALDK